MAWSARPDVTAGEGTTPYAPRTVPDLSVADLADLLVRLTQLAMLASGFWPLAIPGASIREPLLAHALVSLADQLSAALADRYRIERPIGEGGMAIVFLARDLKHDRQVALKVLRPELSAAMGPDRFPREIQILAQMQHPHILPLHDSGEAAGALYFVMPFVEGETLGERIARAGPLPIGEAVRLLRQIADALAYAHARGIVHRDIKPDNVMLSGKHATVTDFGVAKAVQSSARDKHTAVGIAVGTPHYMAPEQATADERTDHRADLYALGVLGYEMLSGAPLFDGETPQAILSAHWLQPPPDIRERRTEVPPALAELLLRCVAKEPEDRWPSAEALVAALEGIDVTGSGERVVPPSTASPLQVEAPPVATVTASTVTASTVPASAVPTPRRWLPVAGGVATAALIMGWMLLRPDSGGPDPIRKIGVLPVEDISGQDAVFVTAMHDGLTAALSRLQLSGVASRSEMLRYKGTAKTTREIARENELGAVVEATVFRAGEVMRINVQFTDPETSRALWSETIERNVSDVLEAQDAVVEVVAKGVRGALTAKSGASE